MRERLWDGVELRRLLASEAIGELVFGHFTTIARRLKTGEDWRNDLEMAGGDAFFEEGIHWLHIAGSLGPRITSIQGYRPQLSTAADDSGDRRPRSMLAAFRYDTGAVGALYYSREVPSLLRGLRGRKAVSREAIVGALLRIGGEDGLLMRHAEDIAEADINPLIVSDHGAVAVDARFVLTKNVSGEQ